MRLTVCDDRPLRSWIHSFGPLARVLAPARLARDVFQEIEDTRDLYMPRGARDMIRMTAGELNGRVFPCGQGGRLRLRRRGWSSYARGWYSWINPARCIRAKSASSDHTRAPNSAASAPISKSPSPNRCPFGIDRSIHSSISVHVSPSDRRPATPTMSGARLADRVLTPR